MTSEKNSDPYSSAYDDVSFLYDKDEGKSDVTC